MSPEEYALAIYEWLERRDLVKSGKFAKEHALSGITALVMKATNESYLRGMENSFTNPEG
jgi:hypothetical protein